MSTEAIAVTLLVGVFLVLLFLRVSVAVSMGIAAIVTYAYLKLPLALVVQYTVGGVNNFTFMAVPFFILGGELINQGGIGDRLVKLADELVGWMHGGSAMVNVLASMFFGGISGSAPADIAALGPIEIKLMESQGFSREYSTGLTCATAVGHAHPAEPQPRYLRGRGRQRVHRRALPRRSSRRHLPRRRSGDLFLHLRAPQEYLLWT